ncbi:hypothetical protein CLAFUW4_00136 [Fulvia fulva]|uniref:Uncharacterized protein n=1 Tax=Passalora fulva TaxID=5499 RepID=A0A9Q8L9M5_PASFU|nr:uncharacterized protein CLAFUR5_00134 [Fulvia fulva]KAK4634853.1 hypothetical protein CLAFUR4_00136 [Fulvia fulva]KAK4637457.1 hypothetical protein CLAFUR0_00134 [Fulvia fulva]UJO12728.1 hypothetical protein CLAFUR5_00134 [Fulvia fulva]WPV10388.1 hypothetical protein CLAFUW4_00136 [Fulvia fulva]WPV24005.1 hypothetical protein CLAFUW7_00136 [Fulvia fulva]
MKEIIETALRAGCNVDGPKLMDDFALKATHFKQGGAFEDVLRSLRQFSYVTLQDTEDGLHTIWMQQHWMVISEILQHAASLQEFDLTLSNLSAEVHLGSALADLCTTVFTTAEVPCLRTLCLCWKTFSVLGEGDVWAELVKLLSSMPCLANVCLRNLFKRPRGATPAQVLNELKNVRFMVTGEKERQQLTEMERRETVDVHPFLERAIECGLQYESWR